MGFFLKCERRDRLSKLLCICRRFFFIRILLKLLYIRKQYQIDSSVDNLIKYLGINILQQMLKKFPLKEKSDEAENGSVISKKPSARPRHP